MDTLQFIKGTTLLMRGGGKDFRLLPSVKTPSPSHNRRYHLITSASANNQLRHIRILSVQCYEDDIVITTRISNLSIQT